jgi:DNA-directed RNA polymerase delta subunit
MNKSTINVEKFDQKEASSQDKLEFFHLASRILSFLPERSQDIMKRRYGLIGNKAETLEKIGHDYNITRERVRQIVSDALKNISLRQDDENFKRAENLLILAIEKNKGIIAESEAVKTFNMDGAKEANAIKFLASCSKKIKTVSEKEIMEKSWALSEETLKKAEKIGTRAGEILNQEKKVMSGEAIAKKIAHDFPELEKEEILSLLGVLVKVKRNKFGKWGINNWAEISPKGTREKIYIVLKETQKPLHFTKIAGLIDEYKLGSKKAHPQTVHNELIKDDRFVLIGRGIYALAEWGYFEGTIKDVLKEILEKSQKPLDKEEILSEVLKIRKVKKNTVLINLNNEQMFERRDNRYTLRG